MIFMKNIFKIKKILLIIAILFAGIMLASCSSSKNYDYDNANSSGGNASGDTGGDIVLSGTDRKIVYTADITMHSNNLSETYSKVRELFPTNTWTESERLGESYYHIVIRVKTESFDVFVSSLSEAGEVKSVNKTSEDVTSSYNLLTYRKQVLETEYERLIELAKTASASEIVNTINPRRSQIEKELLTINNNLTEYDELIEYSTINLNIYKNIEDVEEEEKGFFKTIGEAFLLGFKVLKNVFKYGVSFVFIVGPTMLVFLGGVLGIVFIVKAIKKRKNKSNKD